MRHSTPSTLSTDHGRQVSLRLNGQIYELSQDDLRTILGLPSGRPGLGITIENDLFTFEFSQDDHVVELSARQLQRKLAKQLIIKR